MEETGQRGSSPGRLRPHVRQTDRPSELSEHCQPSAELPPRSVSERVSEPGAGITKGRKVGREEIASSKFKLPNECRWRPPSLVLITVDRGGRPAGRLQRRGGTTRRCLSSAVTMMMPAKSHFAVSSFMRARGTGLGRMLGRNELAEMK